MFRGSIPPDLRSVIHEHVEAWGVDEVAVTTSGNLTVERAIHEFVPKLHANDVQVYSCALGWWFAEQRVPMELKPETAEALPWLEDYLDGGAGTLAVVLLGSGQPSFFKAATSDNPYYQRVLVGIERQFPEMHAKTVDKIRKATLRLESFFAGDVREYVRLHRNLPIVSFPPFFCLAPEHRILTDSLEWVPCGELREGDGVLAFDEEPAPGQRIRRWRYGHIVRSERRIADCVRVRLEDGTSIVCTADHPWLARSRTPRRRWVAAQDLLTAPQHGYAREVERWVQRILPTWERADTYDAGWLAGMFDGEGHVYISPTNSARAVILQRPGPIADRIAQILKRHDFEFDPRVDATGVMHVSVMRGTPELLRALGTFGPQRLIDRLRTDLDISALSIRSRGESNVRVVDVEPIGPHPIQSLQTSTGTYIGEGFAMHNSGDYESQFKALDDALDWPKPEYPELDQDGVDALIEDIADRRHWLIGLHIRRERLEGHLRAKVQTTNRGVPIYVYASTGRARVVRPRQSTEIVPNHRLQVGEELGERMSLAPLTLGQFATLRSQYMNPAIRPGTPYLAVAVLVDGVVIGSFAVGPSNHHPTTAYMLSDFPVGSTDYPRLSKLVVYAAMSRESRLLLQKRCGTEMRRIRTTAFTSNPVSMKYRNAGIPPNTMKLEKRDEAPPEERERGNELMLNYAANYGEWSLAEGFGHWRAKHGKRRTRAAA